MSDAELVAFRMRCIQATQHGHEVARADKYMAALSAEAGGVEAPAGSKEGSAAHLAAMADAAIDVRSGKTKKKAAPSKKAEPPKSSPKAAAPAHAKSKKEPKVMPTYDSWTHDELYAEAQGREIPNRSKMTKEELIEALEESDEDEES